MVLNKLQIDLAEQMLLVIKNKEMNITYKEISERVNPPMNPRNVGHNIGEVCKLCYELGLPLISAIVINSNTHNPGDGFYNIYKMYYPDIKGLSPSQIYQAERQKIRECKEWYKIADYLEIDIDLPRPNSLEIRILPMSKKIEFPKDDYEDVQREYFMDRLQNENNGYYFFRESGINCSPGSLILFQFDNQIIAYAILLEIKRFEAPKDGLYKGAYVLDKNSIQVFEPLSSDDINKIDPEFEGFTQTKQRINYKYLPQVQALVEKRMYSAIPEELPLSIINKYPEGCKKQITVNAYERNPKARQDCIDFHGTECTICGFDFGKFYGGEFKGKIHVHHIKPVAEQDGNYEIDPINDLIPVCPNCHLALHSKGNGVYSIEEIRKKIKMMVQVGRIK